jgi:hypothetical protein
MFRDLRWHKVLVTALVAVSGLGALRAAAAEPPYPRLANMYLHGSVDPADIPALARWDVLILDAAWSRAQLQQLRILNPNIKIYFYVCAYCMEVPPPGDAWRAANYAYASSNDLWWRNWNQTIATDWPGSQLVNITDLGPSGPQGNWRQYIGGRVETLVRDYPELDGVFYDNFWKSIGWEQGGVIQVDSDCNPTHNPGGCNGIMDSDAVVDTLWNRALRNLAQDTRTRFDNVVAQRGGRPLSLITNSSADYFGWLNGTLHEYFPSGSSNPDPGNPYGYNWNQEMLGLPGGYLVAPFRTTPYNVSVLNADWSGTWDSPDRSPDFERHKRFTLASALMGDGYYSLDAADTGHGSIWWEPEFDHGGRGKGYLGYPLGPMQRIGVPSGSERIVNGTFTASTAPWQSLATQVTGTWGLDTANFHSAPSAARIDVTSMQSPSGNFKIWQSVPVELDHGYSLSFWAKASTPQTMTLHLYSTSCPNIRCLNDQFLQLGTTWTRYEIPFVASGTATSGLNVFVQKAGTVWFDDFSLREGDTSVYRRNFENGIVLLNYTTTSQMVNLNGTFRHLSLPGMDKYDGALVTSELLAASDGRILLNGSSTPSPAPPPVPMAVLQQNEPNPFNPTTRIRYELQQAESVHLAVYDIAGRLVRTLVARRELGGVERVVTWDGTDRWGAKVRSGVYFYTLSTPSFTQTRKMTMLK